jgi:hypothetical protein
MTQPRCNDLQVFYGGLADLQAARRAMLASPAKIRDVDAEQRNAYP